MAKVCVELGNQAYLWKEPAGYAQDVVISAHGFYRNTTPNWAPGASTLYFYCADGGTVDDVPQSTRVRATPPAQIVPNGAVVNCRDYILKKFGEHRADIRAAATRQGLTFLQAEQALGQMGGETYATFRDVNDPLNDYVTVRNRGRFYGGPEIALSTLIGLIRAQHVYGIYKCCFCREQR